MQERNGPYRGHECLIRIKNGTLVYVLENVALIHDNTGKPAFIEGTVLDITERNEAEKKLLKSEARYKMLLSNMTDGFFCG